MYFGHQKIGGMLIENISCWKPHKGLYRGIGINVNQEF
ncbi:hypothetical protein CS542_01495 [Pedobacter sp. IW39]|nr:hypothetical protein CS542_01495 [Pedobacter sp. IW39]